MKQCKTRAIYLPKGTWYDYFSKDKYVSQGQWIEKQVELKTMPMFVKEGTVLSYCAADRSLCDGMGEIIRQETWKD